MKFEIRLSWVPQFYIFVLFSFFILCFLGCIPLFFMRDFGCIIACAPPNDNACWNFDIKARNALHWLRRGLLEKWRICGLNFFSFGSRWHSITGAYFMNLGQSCEECVETEQVTRWHAEVLWREYPIACELRLKWSCQSDLRYAASSILKKLVEDLQLWRRPLRHLGRSQYCQWVLSS